MLVASTAVGLFAPIASQASDIINLDGINDYSRKSKKSSKQRLDSKTFINNENLTTVNGIDNSLNSESYIYEAGSFSDSTTADQSVIFSIGAADFEGVGADTSDATKNEGLKLLLDACKNYSMELDH